MAHEFVNISCETSKKILVVGLTNIDVINVCDHYPIEDEDMRVLSQRWTPGGNACNTARVLSQHKNVQVDLFSGLSSKSENAFIIKKIQQTGVNTELCKFYDHHTLPMATCILNNQNGSRTILSYSQSFPKLNAKTFVENVDINNYDIIHFEGRDLDDVSRMIDHVLRHREGTAKPLISGEMEKPKRLLGLEMHIQPKVDLLFVNKDIARSKGYKDAMETVTKISNLQLNARYIICPWGDQGAAFAELLQDENVWRYNKVPAFKLWKAVDTLGAGDTFIAGVIYGLLAVNDTEKAVTYACYLAKKKCEIIGFENVLQ